MPSPRHNAGLAPPSASGAIRYNAGQERGKGTKVMKAFIGACVVAVLVAAIGLFVLEGLQVPADVAFSTNAVRLGS